MVAQGWTAATRARLGLGEMSAMGRKNTKGCKLSILRLVHSQLTSYSQLTKADDKILDCCIYFAKHDEDYRAAVWLWTDDRNLKVQVSYFSFCTCTHLTDIRLRHTTFRQSAIALSRQTQSWPSALPITLQEVRNKSGQLLTAFTRMARRWWN